MSSFRYPESSPNGRWAWEGHEFVASDLLGIDDQPKCAVCSWEEWFHFESVRRAMRAEQGRAWIASDALSGSKKVELLGQRYGPARVAAWAMALYEASLVREGRPIVPPAG